MYIKSPEQAIGTVVVLNPNAVMYEFTIYENELINFYHSQRINVFLWNYRGYGRSKGTPSPSKVISDAKIIMEYVIKCYLDNENHKIIIHGHSLGGAVASSLDFPEVNFVLCD